MKKILLIIVLFFNLIPVLKEGKIEIIGAFEALATEEHSNEMPDYDSECGPTICGDTQSSEAGCYTFVYKVDCICYFSGEYLGDQLLYIFDNGSCDGGGGDDGGGDNGGEDDDDDQEDEEGNGQTCEQQGLVTTDCGCVLSEDDCYNQQVATYYEDADNDGWGNTNNSQQATLQPSGWVLRKGDYNDNCYSSSNAIHQCKDPCDDSVVRPVDVNNISDILGTVTSFGNTIPGMPELATQLQNGIDVTWNSAINGLIDRNYVDNLLADLKAVGTGKGLALLSSAGKLLGLGAIILNVADLSNQYSQTDALCAKTLADFAVNAGSLAIKSNIVGFAISSGWLIIKETL